MNLILPEHIGPFCDFSRQLLETLDIDPQYYTLKGFADEYALSDLERFEFCTVFYGFNHIGSADKFFFDRSIDPIALPYGRNRRGFRGNRKVLDFIQDVLAMRALIFEMREKPWAWEPIYLALLSARGCGPWSAYCLTEALKIVANFPISAPDFGDVKSSKNKTGPLAALELITGIPITSFEKRKDLHRAVFLETTPYVKWKGLEEMESALCNYMSLLKGTYYVGRDIDRQIPALKDARGIWWTVRRKIFPESTLGEIGGWTGPRKELMGRWELGKKWIA